MHSHGVSGMGKASGKALLCALDSVDIVDTLYHKLRRVKTRGASRRSAYSRLSAFTHKDYRGSKCHLPVQFRTVTSIPDMSFLFH